jgi:hypothetical protein
MKRPGSLLMGIALVLIASGTLGQVPQLLNYQGRPTDPNGNPEENPFSPRDPLFSS